MFRVFFIISILITPLSLVLLYKGLDSSSYGVALIIGGMVLSIVSTAISFILGRKKNDTLLKTFNKWFLFINVLINICYFLFLGLFLTKLFF